jgi:hypothetical protein
MNNGVAYLLRLKFLLDLDNLPMPRGIVLTDKMFDDIRHAYPALIDGEDSGMFLGIKVHREKKSQ